MGRQFFIFPGRRPVPLFKGFPGREFRSDCKKKSSHIKYAAYLKKLFHPPSLSALLSTHFSENAHFLSSWYIRKKPPILVYKLFDFFLQ